MFFLLFCFGFCWNQFCEMYFACLFVFYTKVITPGITLITHRYIRDRHNVNICDSKCLVAPHCCTLDVSLCSLCTFFQAHSDCGIRWRVLLRRGGYLQLFTGKSVTRRPTPVSQFIIRQDAERNVGHPAQTAAQTIDKGLSSVLVPTMWPPSIRHESQDAQRF